MSGPPVLQFRVAGLPRTQGSHRPMMTRHKDPEKRRAILVQQNSDAHEKWRATVQEIAEKARRRAGLPTITAPVKVLFLFSIHRGASSKYERPTAKNHGDVSKLARAVEDALTDAKVWEDDGLICYELIVKDFPGPRVAQTSPGVIVRIWLDEPGLPGQGSLLQQEESSG